MAPPQSQPDRGHLGVLDHRHIFEQPACLKRARHAVLAEAVGPPAGGIVVAQYDAAGMSDAECEDLMSIVSETPSRFDCGVLLIEHNMSVIMGVSHRIHVLDGGRSVAEGTPEAIRNDPAVIGAYLGMEA